MLPDNEQENYELFRDALSSTILQNVALDTPKERRRAKGRQGNYKSKDDLAAKAKTWSSEKVEDSLATNDAEDLAEFIDVRLPSSLTNHGETIKSCLSTVELRIVCQFDPQIKMAIFLAIFETKLPEIHRYRSRFEGLQRKRYIQSAGTLNSTKLMALICSHC